MGVCSNGGLNQKDAPSDQTYCRGLQSGGKYRLQVPRREPKQPGACSVLCERVPGLQCTKVSFT